MIDFIKEDSNLLFRYTPERGNWVTDVIQREGEVTFKGTFTFNVQDLVQTTKPSEKEIDQVDFEEDFETSFFLFAKLKGEYYKIRRSILVETFDIYIHKEIILQVSYFVADSNVSIFKVISGISKDDFYIGGNNPSAIPLQIFDSILKYFPKPYERKKYVEARLASVLRNYLDNVKDAERSYQKYLNTKLSKQGSDLRRVFQDIELIKYQNILEKLQEMLKDENQYSEHQWQEEILQIILLLYPKYIFAFKSVPVYAKFAGGIKEKQLDILLIDSNGYVDVIEIKKPFENAIMTKGVYRENYIPLRELSGTVMQIEKYIYYLNRWSFKGERFLSEKYQQQLPTGFDIKIANPNGLIIMGRENNLSFEQKGDFEVVKRKYKNVVDIITYDNLIERIKFTIEQIKKV